jgi:hypothetical protein
MTKGVTNKASSVCYRFVDNERLCDVAKVAIVETKLPFDEEPKFACKKQKSVRLSRCIVDTNRELLLSNAIED